MTQHELKAHRVTLQNKRAALLYGNRSRGALAIEATADEMEQTQGAQDRDLAIGIFDRDATLLQDVRSALVRIEAGTFGICVECESDISGKRLAAVPWAAMCIVCQEAADRQCEQPWKANEYSLVNAA